MTRAFHIAALLAVAGAVTSGVAAGAPLSAHGSAAIIVSDVSELHAALVPANADRRIIVRAGTYLVSSPLVVPDGATLAGEGVMLGNTLPTGFAPGTETTLRALPVFSGDVLRLGNNSSLRNLAVVDSAGRSGNPVAVRSRAQGDLISASISECVIRTPNGPGIVPDGPTGRAIAVVTQNPGLGAAPPPHEGAELALTIRRSVVTAPLAPGDAVFAVNFAAHAHIDLQLRENVIVGIVNPVGGVSRPDRVSFASATLDSRGNSYSSNYRAALVLYGGSSAPLPVPTAPTSSNAVIVRSVGDRIESGLVGIEALGARRFSTLGGLVSDNTVSMEIRDLALSTPSGASDLTLAGARSEGEFPPGDRNTVTIDIRDSTGSGPRVNVYADTLGSVLPENWGIGNRLHISGSVEAFTQSNPGIEPPPGAEFFDGL